ncbi:hypothetical protein WMY93_033805 [Mugilogobius chulae]|uniref:Uncharacterized protein n=1 Tax=Mugilogobius chulae TaxID=88201 RepID=A0AAW0MK04_9GOBI
MYTSSPGPYLDSPDPESWPKSRSCLRPAGLERQIGGAWYAALTHANAGGCFIHAAAIRRRTGLEHNERQGRDNGIRCLQNIKTTAGGHVGLERKSAE